MPETSAADLVAWTTQRDEAAFRRLVETHSGLVTSLCRRQLGAGPAAADAAQAVFILLARRATTIANSQALTSWIYRTALNVCRNAQRASARRSLHEQDAAMVAARNQHESTEDNAIWTEMRPELDSAISSLATRERAVVIGHFLQGLPHAVVAERLGVSEKTVRTDAGNALTALRLWFNRRGMVVGAGVLVVGLAGEAQAAEPALTAAYVHAGLHPASAAGANALASGVGAMGIGVAKLVAGVTAIGLAAVGGTAVLIHALTAPLAPSPPALAAAAMALPAERPSQTIFRHEFDAVPGEEQTTNELVVLREPGGEVTAIASRPYTGGKSPGWHPDEQIDWWRSEDAEGRSRTMFILPADPEIRIRVKAEKPGTLEFTMTPTLQAVKNEHYSCVADPTIGPDWTELVLRDRDIRRWPRQAGASGSAAGVSIAGFGFYGVGTGRILIDRFEIRTSNDVRPRQGNQQQGEIR